MYCYCRCGGSSRSSCSSFCCCFWQTRMYLSNLACKISASLSPWSLFFCTSTIIWSSRSFPFWISNNFSRHTVLLFIHLHTHSKTNTNTYSIMKCLMFIHIHVHIHVRLRRRRQRRHDHGATVILTVRRRRCRPWLRLWLWFRLWLSSRLWLGLGLRLDDRHRVYGGDRRRTDTYVRQPLPGIMPIS